MSPCTLLSATAQSRASRHRPQYGRSMRRLFSISQRMLAVRLTRRKGSGRGTVCAGVRRALLPGDGRTECDTLRWEGEYWGEALAKALSPSGSRRVRFNERGFVAFALPPVQNARLSSQQGAFLFSGADELTFEQSLFRMMSECDFNWCRLFEISADARTEIERRLFQMNIHDLSLFPDMEGLAGFIRQKTRLHWVPV